MLPDYSIQIGRPKGSDEIYLSVVWRSRELPRKPNGELPQVRRRLGPAWHERAANGDWVKRKGRAPEGYLVRDQWEAQRLAKATVERVEAELRLKRESEAASEASFRFLARAWLKDLRVPSRETKPKYLVDMGSMLAEPGSKQRRGSGTNIGRLMGAFGDRDPRTLTTREVDDIFAEWQLGRRNHNAHREVLLRVLRFAVREQLLPGLEVHAVERTRRKIEPSVNTEATYSEEEVHKIAAAFDDRAGVATVDACLVRFLFYTGLRIGEARALQWDQIDLASEHLFVTAGMSAGQRTTPKNRQARQIGLVPQAVDALLEASRLIAGLHPGSLVFPGARGSFMDDGALRRRFDHARELAQVPDRGSLHALRHAAATRVATEHGAHVARDLLGHSKITTTDRYLHGAGIARNGAALASAFAPDTANSR